MIKTEKIEVCGWEGAIRGMRNPMNSWERADSHYCDFELSEDCDICGALAVNNTGECLAEREYYCVGENDLGLMKKLFMAGTEHRKFLRQVFVSMDITAPLYWWKEYDTYKVGTTANSCSTMHKITAKPIELSDFSIDDYMAADDEVSVRDCFINVIADCEMYRKKYLETKDKHYWRALIQLLPSSYNQKRTVTMDYENVFSMIRQRSGHKLDEWREFVRTLKTLPYVREIGGFEEEEKKEMGTEHENTRRVFPVCVSHELKDLSNIPHRDIAGTDLAIIAGVLKEKPTGDTSGVESLVQAEKEVPDFKLLTLTSLLGIEEEGGSGLYVLGTEDGHFGAVVLGYPGELKKTAQFLGEGFYILPSSVHEVLILPDSKASDIKPEELQQMVAEINQTQVQENERLSNSVYHFDGEKLKVAAGPASKKEVAGNE